MSRFKNLKVKSKLILSFVIIIALAAGTGVFIIVNMKDVTSSYEDAMEITSLRLTHIFASKDHFARAQMIVREFYFPENTTTDLIRLSSELDRELDELSNSLNSLHAIAAPAVQEVVLKILPLIDMYHNDMKLVADSLLATGDVSIDDPDYRITLMDSEETTNAITKEYAATMTDSINTLSDMSINVLKNLSATNSAYADRIIFTSFLLFTIVALLSLSIALWIPRLISKPLITLSSFMKKAGSTGNLKLEAADIEVIGKYSRIKDEIGETITGAAAFVSHVTNISNELAAVSDGDLTVEISKLSDEDTMAVSLMHMIDSFSNMVGEIQTTTDQVSEGSRHVADGAQALAQGSTQQAASIEELSSSITQIAEKTKQNASTAERASKLSMDIRLSAEKGSHQMDEMITAVKDINDASQSISKIIKTIDDIAFQTNILALNAAVEAARAGQHGKGFAVVAEEVRNLAAKSAEAAKETGVMIQNSMEKAELGSSIADETATSLAEIVSGINESSHYIEEIARASEEQALGIEQINIGIDQVVQVIAQNSATSQESAAASEEMSSQASALEELLRLFKVKNDKTRKRLSDAW